MFQTNFLEEMKYTLCSLSLFYFRKWGRLWDIIEKYFSARQVTDDNIKDGMDIASWMINPLTPNDTYRGRTVLLTSKVAFYIFIQKI